MEEHNLFSWNTAADSTIQLCRNDDELFLMLLIYKFLNSVEMKKGTAAVWILIGMKTALLIIGLFL